MKKLTLVIIAVLGALSGINARSMQFGARAVRNIADFSGGVEDTKTAIHIGVIAEFNLSDPFSLRPELHCSVQGTKQEANSK